MMPDREKVIKEFELFIKGFHPACTSEGVELDMLREVLAMLKEQESVEPIPPEDEFGLYRCGKCHHQLFRCVDKYCSRCGRSVKWG